jgi:hypothetical protein
MGWNKNKSLKFWIFELKLVICKSAILWAVNCFYQTYEFIYFCISNGSFRILKKTLSQSLCTPLCSKTNLEDLASMSDWMISAWLTKTRSCPFIGDLSLVIHKFGLPVTKLTKFSCIWFLNMATLIMWLRARFSPLLPQYIY